MLRLYKSVVYFAAALNVFDTVTADKCGLHGTFNKILGGQSAEIDEFPWMARLEYKNNKNHSVGFACTGTLVDRNIVLTAGHCIAHMQTQNLTLFSVRLGEYDTTTNPDCIEYSNGDLDCADPYIDVRVEKYIIHPEYFNGYSDIALIVLEKFVNYTEFIKPVCLPKSKIIVNSGDWYTTAGWGKTDDGTNSTVKLKVNIPVSNFEKCSRKYVLEEGLFLSRYRHFCAGGVRGQDTCTGDSGAPLMVQGKDAAWRILGITSIGKGCGDPQWPGIYTKVSHYTKWIREESRKK